MVFLCMAAFILGIAASVIFNFPILWALIWGIFCFMGAAAAVGQKLPQILKMMTAGVKTSLSVIKIFVFIGLITASWRASGTIPFFVYWGIKIISPKWFILCAFLMPAAISFLLGTSFGTVGTIGVVLMVLGRSGAVNPLITAGAILSGAYFGDRCSPTSSSLSLVCTLTGSDFYWSIKEFFKDSAPAFILSCLIYSMFSAKNPLLSQDTGALLVEISDRYNLNPLVCLPAIVILILPFFKLDIKKSMAVSIISACILAFFVQGAPLLTVASQLLMGYTPSFDSWFGDLIKGGGLLSMVNSTFVIIIASTYAGIIKEAHIFNGLDEFIMKLDKKAGIFPTTLLVALTTALFSCNQTLCIMLTHQLMEGVNKAHDSDPLDVASSIANTAVVISPLIPWNIAVSIPLGMMSVGWGAIPYAFYLVLIPLTMCIKSVITSHKNK